MSMWNKSMIEFLMRQIFVQAKFFSVFFLFVPCCCFCCLFTIQISSFFTTCRLYSICDVNTKKSVVRYIDNRQSCTVQCCIHRVHSISTCFILLKIINDLNLMNFAFCSVYRTSIKFCLFFYFVSIRTKDEEKKSRKLPLTCRSMV